MCPATTSAVGSMKDGSRGMLTCTRLDPTQLNSTPPYQSLFQSSQPAALPTSDESGGTELQWHHKHKVDGIRRRRRRWYQNQKEQQKEKLGNRPPKHEQRENGRQPKRRPPKIQGIFSTQTNTYNPSEEEEGEEQWSDDEPPVPDRADVLETVRKLKIELKTIFTIEFNELVSYLKVEGFSGDEPYKQAMRAVIEGRLADTKKRERISNRIGQYIAIRLFKTKRLYDEILGVLDWDDEILNLIIMAIEDIKDLLVRFPELEELLRATYDTLNANAKWKAQMAETLKDYVRTWIRNSRFEFEWMKNWEKCPSETIETSRKFEYPL